jgi:NCS1 family nucleobase:cation symporter-1
MIMSFLNLRPESGFLGPAIVIGAISIVGALWQGILDRFLGFLLLIGTFFVPVFVLPFILYLTARFIADRTTGQQSSAGTDRAPG